MDEDVARRAAAERLVTITKDDHDGLPYAYTVRLGTRAYHYRSEVQAVEEREWWIEFLADALQQARAEVWREAAQYLNEGEVLTTGEELDARCKCQCFAMLGRIAAYFEARAQEGG